MQRDKKPKALDRSEAWMLCAILGLTAVVASCGGTANWHLGDDASNGDAFSGHMLSDDYVRNANVTIVSASSAGEMSFGCRCDDGNYGTAWREDRLDRDGRVDSFSFCNRPYYMNDPNEGDRCSGDIKSQMVLEPNRWLATKKALLQAKPTKLAGNYNCLTPGIVCVSDFTTLHLEVTVDDQSAGISWPSYAAGLPKGLQRLLDVLEIFSFRSLN